MPPSWTRSTTRAVADCRVFKVRADKSVDPRTGDEREYFVIESADWVNVIALTDADDVVLIEQFRHGTRASTLEIPGGMVDAGEEPLAAGLRELAEETGYGGGHARLLGSVEPNPAIQDNRCWTILVEGVTRVAEPRPDDDEQIVVRVEPLATIPTLIAEGSIAHALVVAAFHRLDLDRR